MLEAIQPCNGILDLSLSVLHESSFLSPSYYWLYREWKPKRFCLNYCIIC